MEKSQPYPQQGYPQQGYPPQEAPPAYPGPGVGGPPPVVVTTQPLVNPVTRFREISVPVKCIHCQADVTTTTHYETGLLTWVACGIILLVGLACPLAWLGCCFIPFCVPSLKDVVHTCPNCQQIVGRYSRMS